MKQKSTLTVVVLLIALLAMPVAVLAQYAVTQPWTSTIYYYNPADEGGDLQVTYFNALTDDLPIDSPTIPVAANQAGEVYIGDTTVAAGFKGSALLSASVPVLAVYEQAAAGTDPNYGRLLYTAFEASQAAEKVFIPSFYINPKGYQSQVGIQPVTGEVDIQITLFDKAGTAVAMVTKEDLPMNESFIFDAREAATYPELVASGILTKPFDGSAVVEVIGSGQIVAAVEELQANGRRAHAFEGISTVASTVYVASGACKFSTGAQTSTLEIQNAGNLPANILITAFRENTATRTPTGAQYTVPGAALLPGAKVTVNTCSIPGTSTRSVSLKVESNNGEELAVVGKVTASTGLTTSFVGKPLPAAGTATTVVLPYVNWAANQAKGYRATIWVMNVTGETATVTATFHDRTGFTKTYNLPAIPSDTKRSFTPLSAAALKPDKSFKGAVEITSNKDIIVVVRLEKKVTGVTGYTVFGEDYMGIPYIPE